MPQINLTCVVGARPNFVKMAAILQAAESRENVAARLIHTGQHFSPEMSAVFFDQLGMPKPDAYLEAGGMSHAQQTAEIMKRIEPEFEAHRPDLLVVVGDVNSTVAASLVATKLHIQVAHVEAGLRSGDRTMPEEVNRLVTDVLSDYLFASEPSGVENLRSEGVSDDKIFLVGNVMIDTLVRFRERAAESDVLAKQGLEPRNYAVVTLHRPANVDDPTQLRALLEVLNTVADRLPVVFPMHPRTKNVVEREGIPLGKIQLLPPLGYLDFLRLQEQARLMLTDSGGIQEETTILHVPCLTLRDNTERPATITQGSNKLVGTDPQAVKAAAHAALDDDTIPTATPDLWDGKTSERILDQIEILYR